MFPILFQFPDGLPIIGGKALHTYGLMAALGFLAGLLWVRRESKRVGLNPDKMTDLFFYIVVSAIVGSRLYYVFASVPEWWKDPMVFIRVWEGGLVFYGGLIASVLVSLWYTRKHRISFLSVADIFTPGISLGHALGRVGCFAAGCCYGREAPLHSFLAVIYPKSKETIAPSGIPLYPVQLFEFFGELVIFITLVLFHRKKKFEGELFLIYLILYPILRIILEAFRGDKVRGYLIEGFLSTAQVISILWLIIAVAIWAVLLKRKKVG